MVNAYRRTVPVLFNIMHPNKKITRLFAGATVAALALAASVLDVKAGPFILAGTDADDHGFANVSGNQNGWFFMQRALENLAPGVTTGVKKVTILGSTSDALLAATSAFDLSSLFTTNGWTRETVAISDFATFFGGGGNLSTGILMMDSGSNVGGGVAGTSFDTHANAINTFLGAGGGLFSQANGYSWISALLPTLGTVSAFGSNLALTVAGNAAFPSLTNADLSSGPWHNSFSSIGSLPILATSADLDTFGDPVILGSSGGSITNPDPVGVPDAGSFGFVYLALGGLLVWFRRFSANRAV